MRGIGNNLRFGAAIVLLILIAGPARAWDSGTHRLITRLAIHALPAGPLADLMRAKSIQLQEYSGTMHTEIGPLSN